jgi:hypothetical protein
MSNVKSKGKGNPITGHEGSRGGGGVLSEPRPGRVTPGKDPVLILQEARCASGSVRTCAKNLTPTEIRSPVCPARSQSLYRLSYPAHNDTLNIPTIKPHNKNAIKKVNT